VDIIGAATAGKSRHGRRPHRPVVEADTLMSLQSGNDSTFRHGIRKSVPIGLGVTLHPLLPSRRDRETHTTPPRSHVRGEKEGSKNPPSHQTKDQATACRKQSTANTQLPRLLEAHEALLAAVISAGRPCNAVGPEKSALRLVHLRARPSPVTRNHLQPLPSTLRDWPHPQTKTVILVPLAVQLGRRPLSSFFVSF
jgi:hypothetical protein